MSGSIAYKKAICLPCRGAENKALYPNAEGGVFDKDHQPIPHAFLRREYRRDVKFIGGKWDRTSGQEIKHHPLILPGQIQETNQHLTGTYIFAGYLFPHFGHFLLESLANLWFIKENPDLPIIWLGVHNQPELDTIGQSFVELYGIKNPLHILTEQTEVEELIVPEPGYLIHTRYTDRQVQALKLVEAPEPKAGKKVWLSRSNLRDGKVLNEPYLEKILERQGWVIYHPEDHPISDQIKMLCDAEMIAGVEGSAFHLLLLFPDYKGKVIIFARRKKVEFDFVHIAETLDLDQQVYYPQATVWSHGLMHWAYNLFWFRLTPVLDTLGISRSEVKPQLPNTNMGKITKGIVEHFKHTLLIELWAHDTTLSLTPASCRAICVSPSLCFDTHGLPKHVDHLDITADQLFTGQILKRAPDLYCFRHQGDEQTLIRAFNSSLQLSKPSTLWLIEYDASERETPTSNALTDDERRFSMNKRLVQYIASCHPMLTIVRLRGSNAALVWQHPRKMFTPDLKSFNALSDFSEFERCPVLSLDEAATAYSKDIKRSP